MIGQKIAQDDCRDEFPVWIPATDFALRSTLARWLLPEATVWKSHVPVRAFLASRAF